MSTIEDGSYLELKCGYKFVVKKIIQKLILETKGEV